MSEVVIYSSSDHLKVIEVAGRSTEWLTDTLGFDSYMLKMYPDSDRWEHCRADNKHKSHCEVVSNFKDSHTWLKNFVWEYNLDEFFQDTKIQTDLKCIYLLRQSGPSWVRWYAIFGSVESETTYYFATVFDDIMTAITYRLSV
jgi:hypothetical protein